MVLQILNNDLKVNQDNENDTIERDGFLNDLLMYVVALRLMKDPENGFLKPRADVIFEKSGGDINKKVASKDFLILLSLFAATPQF